MVQLIIVINSGVGSIYITGDRDTVQGELSMFSVCVVYEVEGQESGDELSALGRVERRIWLPYSLGVIKGLGDVLKEVLVTLWRV